MRIVQVVTFVSRDGGFGGPLAVAAAQCQELARQGHDVTLLAGWDGNAELHIPGVRVILGKAEIVPRLGFSGVYSPAVSRWLSTHRDSIDVLHIHLGRHILDLQVARWSRRKGIPFHVQTHGMVMPRKSALIRGLDRLVTNQLLQAAVTVFVLSEDEAAGIATVSPLARTQLITNGVIIPPEMKKTKRTGPPEVLFLARLHARKQVLVFAAAAAQLSRAGVSATFTVVGPDEGELPALLRFILSNPDVPLKYDGAVAAGAAPARLRDASIYVLPSVGEVFPMSVIEALSVGTPVVVTSDSAIANALEGCTAAAITAPTEQDLTATLSRILRSDGYLADMQISARSAAASLFNITDVAVALQQAYNRVQRRPRVVWITNQAPPYRLPVWEALSADVDLEVWLLESDAQLERDSNNRGQDWKISSQVHSFQTRVLRTIRVRRGEARHYLSSGISRNRFRGVDAVLIGGWDSPAYWQAAASARRAGARVIGFYESHMGSQQHGFGLIARARRRFFDSLDGVVVPGIAAHQAVSAMGIEEDKIFEGFNAVEGSRFWAEAVRKSKTEIDLPSETATLTLLGIGQLVPRKNWGLVLSALQDERLANATLTLAGTGDEETALRRQATALGVADRVRFLGYVASTHLPRLISSHEILIHPALEEVWGLAVNEALATGIKVVVSESAGVAASVRHMAGVTVTALNALDLVDAILESASSQLPTGPPAILQHGPRELASVFARALVGTTPC